MNKKNNKPSKDVFSLPLIRSSDSEWTKNTMKEILDHGLLPLEKKPYFSKHKFSQGPYMALKSFPDAEEQCHYMLDAASQIATLGFGFNPPTFFGVSHFEEAWTNDISGKNVEELKHKFEAFLRRKSGLKKTSLYLTHSGSEANETALGIAYNFRKHIKANKVLAFEGSFHGRMMIALAATWNKSKREPFEWDEYLQEYLPYPTADDGVINRVIPQGFQAYWRKAAHRNFREKVDVPKEVQKLIDSDQGFHNEMKILYALREKLLSEQIFAILIEPMQCEGGDCYSTNRFHTGLLILSEEFQVPVIYDEVQTGFHLGKEFFWHREFQLNRELNHELKDENHRPLGPAFITMAKKAQVGVVLVNRESPSIAAFQSGRFRHGDVLWDEEFSPQSLIRGLIHGIALDQAQNKIKDLELLIHKPLHQLVKKYSGHLEFPRQNGMAFAINLKDKSLLNSFVDIRFHHGLLYYPAGDQTLRFRANLQFSENDIQLLFEELDKICQKIFYKKSEVDFPELKPTQNFTTEQNPDSHLELYEWHEFLIFQHESTMSTNQILEFAESKMKNRKELQNLKIIELTPQNFLNFRDQIISLQKLCYEPQRQTDIEKFEHTILHSNSINFAIVSNHAPQGASLATQTLKGILFSGPLKLYPLEKGVRNDPFYQDENTLYTLDLTVHPDYQKTGLGRILKYCLMAFAKTKGIQRIHGRNRDRLASSMLSINLSLGARELMYREEDYMDFEDYRDVFYYTINTQNFSAKNSSKSIEELSQNFLSNANYAPITQRSLDREYIHNLFPFLMNKVCLSNFVSEEFLSAIKLLLSKLPKNLQHGYTSSGQSEAIDKIVKSVWYKISKEKKEKWKNTPGPLYQVTFSGHYFGMGSFMSRSLSNQNFAFFPVKRFSHPNELNWQTVINDLEVFMQKEKVLSVFVEPFLQMSGEIVPLQFLIELKKLTQKYDIALLYNETASKNFAYSSETIYASSLPEISPDGGIIYLGGQSAVTYVDEKFFLETPLMLISTWDGDEYATLSYHHQFSKIIANQEQYLTPCTLLPASLKEILAKYPVTNVQLHRGRGYFQGTVPSFISRLFQFRCDRYIVSPSYDAMLDFLQVPFEKV